LDYNFKHDFWSTTTSVGAYASVGPFTAGGNFSITHNLSNNDFPTASWGVYGGIGIGGEKGSMGFTVGYGSAGWLYGIGGSYYTAYERAYMRAEARFRRNINDAVNRKLSFYEAYYAYGAYYGEPKIGFLSRSVYVGNFYGVRVYEHRMFNDGSAVTIPPLGIWVGEGVYGSTIPYNKTVLAHEYGHWLQYEDKGLVYFYGVIAPASFYFALHKNRHGWTEVDANNRAYNFMGKPRWWRFDYFPINP
jgi:hypothetical protein